MTLSDREILERQATLLGQGDFTVETLTAEAQAEKDEKRAVFNRRMTRAFKGIVGSPSRKQRRNLG